MIEKNLMQSGIGKITFLKSTYNPKNFKTISLNYALEQIKNGTFKKEIESFRAIKDEINKKKAKPLLPSFSFNGSFHDSVINTNLSLSSGLFHFDIDKLDDVEKHKQLISCIPSIVFCFVSTSGTGIKGAVRIKVDRVKSDDDFKNVFTWFKSFFMNHGYSLDESCKDVRRLCFVSHDPDIYINYDADIVDVPISVKVDVVKSATNNKNIYVDSKRCIDTVVKMLLGAINGHRHEARLNASRLAGGYIAGGLVGENEIMQAISRASAYIADNGITSKAEQKTIDDGILLGKSKPIYSYSENNANNQSTHPKWEKPTYKIIELPGIKAFPGVMDAVVKQILHIANKPQPELTILSALIGMASGIGGNYKLPGGGRLNLYGLGISGTGTGKDKAMLAGSRLAFYAGAENIGMPASGAGLEDSLEEIGTKLFLGIDEVAHFIAAMNDSKQSHMASLSGNLLKLFTASRGSYVTRKLANSSNNIQKNCINPCVSLLGFACPEKLGEAFGSGSNIDDGLMGRMLVANGRTGVKPMRDKGELHFHADITDIAKRINCNHEVIVNFTDEANAMLDDLLDHFDSASISSTNPFAKNLKVRSFEKCERIAGVLAIWECPETPIIQLEHVLWAKAFVEYSDDAILNFTGNHLHGGNVQANGEKIKSIIAKVKIGEIKPVNETQKAVLKFSGIFGWSCILKASKLSKKDFDEAILHLIDLGEIGTGIKEVNGGNIKVIFCLNS